jgi:hypothetical protein
VPAPAHLPEIPGTAHADVLAGPRRSESRSEITGPRRPEDAGPRGSESRSESAGPRRSEGAGPGRSEGAGPGRSEGAGPGHAEAEAHRRPGGTAPDWPGGAPLATGRGPLVPEPHAISAPLPDPEPITPPLAVTPVPEPGGRRGGKDTKRRKSDDEYVDWVSGLGNE